MRIIEIADKPIHSIAVSPDGRFLGAAASNRLVVVEWFTGELLAEVTGPTPIGQLAFSSDGPYVVHATVNGLFRMLLAPDELPFNLKPRPYAGGIAIAPDGKSLFAAGAGSRQNSTLDKWELPMWRETAGFDFWSPFHRLAFSPSGEFVAGIDADTVELRIAVTGGLNGRHRVRSRGSGFLAFPRDSQSLVFGWGQELLVMETRAGQIVKRLVPSDQQFADAAFLGSGQQLATINRTSAVRLWSVESGEVVREYDWRTGKLTCLCAGADGMTGFCSTSDGRVVAFDFDE